MNLYYTASQSEFNALVAGLKKKLGRDVSNVEIATIVGKDKSAITRYMEPGKDVPENVLIILRGKVYPELPQRGDYPPPREERVVGMDSAKHSEAIDAIREVPEEAVDEILPIIRKYGAKPSRDVRGGPAPAPPVAQKDVWISKPKRVLGKLRPHLGKQEEKP